MVRSGTQSTTAAKITSRWLTDETYSAAGMTERKEESANTQLSSRSLAHDKSAKDSLFHAPIHGTFTADPYGQLYGRYRSGHGGSRLPRVDNAGNPLSQSEMLR
jgi:hypothetical protein